MRISFLLLFLMVGPAWFARADVGSQFPVPQLTQPVMDEAHMLSPQATAVLNNLLYALNNQTGTQIAILTVPSLKGDAIESVSIHVTDVWKLGKKGQDKGLLFLLAAKEHRVRIEVGKGLEGRVPDARAKDIISDVMVPYFKAGHMNEGVLAGVVQVIQLAEPKFPVAQYLNGAQLQAPPAHQKNSGWGGLILFLAFFFLFMFGGRSGWLGFLLGTALGSSWGGIGGGGFGGGGGGFGGFGGGGGGFDGGGASGGW